MANVVVVGSQWGDEGKGKIVDWLSERADVVVRFQGGHNAGHTLVIDGVVYKLSLLPSGIVRPGKASVIGNGVVLDINHLNNEVTKLEIDGIDVKNRLFVSYGCPLILDYHIKLDQAREAIRTEAKKIGTTGKGIGPAYEDKVARRSFKVYDLLNPTKISDKLEDILELHNFVLKNYLKTSTVDFSKQLDEIYAQALEIIKSERKASTSFL
ncbi:MAG: adenylosuccinate synthetase, partial [Rhodospirillales bacterium]